MTSSSSPDFDLEQLDDRVIEYVLETLTPAERAAFEAACQANPALAAQLHTLQSVGNLLAEASPPLRAPVALRSKVLDQCTHGMGTVPPSRSTLPSAQPKQRGWNGRRIGTAIAALAVLVLGVDYVHLQQQYASLNATVAALQNPETLTFQMIDIHHKQVKDLHEPSFPVGRVLLDLDAAEVIIVFQQLPPTPPGKHYALWAVMKDEAVFCGSFASSNSRQGFVRFRAPIEEYGSPILSMQLFLTDQEDSQLPSQNLVMESTLL
jgi:hypothetical protein